MTDTKYEKLMNSLKADRRDMFYAGYEAGKASSIPGRNETLEFLYGYTTPSGLVSTRIDTFVDDLIEFLENWRED